MSNFILKVATPALLYADNPNRNPWRIDLLVYSLFIWLCDIVAAHTVWAYLHGFPQKGEWTISHTLERLCVNPGKDSVIKFAKEINSISPGHIKILGVLNV